MSQNDRIVRHMEQHGSITAAEAMKEYGIMRLASRIHDIRAAGVPVIGTTETGENRYGERTRYTRYSLGGAANV